MGQGNRSFVVFRYAHATLTILSCPTPYCFFRHSRLFASRSPACDLRRLPDPRPINLSSSLFRPVHRPSIHHKLLYSIAIPHPIRDNPQKKPGLPRLHAGLAHIPNSHQCPITCWRQRRCGTAGQRSRRSRAPVYTAFSPAVQKRVGWQRSFLVSILLTIPLSSLSYSLPSLFFPLLLVPLPSPRRFFSLLSIPPPLPPVTSRTRLFIPPIAPQPPTLVLYTIVSPPSVLHSIARIVRLTVGLLSTLDLSERIFEYSLVPKAEAIHVTCAVALEIGILPLPIDPSSLFSSPASLARADH
ncbi:hypothetical protein EJ06DRAFT_228056 [Trichodelitschia bisporula]|uniref:Uncharacterized protein n=1 Tax=Trichodelitschia bisporula TaxID=703511 RepID=A0A6G1HKR6_9PEZI|nr:hypothetical protein EJ06DRAFT_228056 [Trichodelitschia bisporula]